MSGELTPHTTTSQARPSARVAYFTMEYPRATDTFIRREIDGLRAAGLEIMTFAVRRPGDDEMVSDEQRIARDETTYVLPPSVGNLVGAHLRLMTKSPKRWLDSARLAWSTSRAGVKGRLYQLFYFVEAGVIADSLIERDVDHVHAHFGDVATSVAMIASSLADRPYSFTLHGPGVFFDANVWELGTKIERSRFVSCISWFARSQAQLLSDEDAASKLHIIHCGIDPDRYSSAPERGLAIDGGPTKLAFVARLDHVKGLTILLDAMRDARASGADVELTVVGDGPKRSAFERHARKAGVSDVVNFVGYQSQDGVAEVLSDAHAFVLPSFAEGVPVSLMEASASGLPVIATQVGGVSELVIDGETGFIVPPGDVNALTQRIVSLAADRDLCRRLGAAGRKRVFDDFDSGVEAARLATLFVASASERGAATVKTPIDQPIATRPPLLSAHSSGEPSGSPTGQTDGATPTPESP